MKDAVNIGLMGDFDPGKPSHIATNLSLQHAADRLSLQLKVRWIPTPTLLSIDGQKAARKMDALWAAPGSPYKSQDGVHWGIRQARENKRPFFAT